MSGGKEVARAFANIIGVARDVTKQAVWLTANDVKTMAQESIAKQSHGTVYTKTSQGGNNKISHLASKAGDAPNTDTGRLIQSMAVESDDLTAEIWANTSYAEALEFGTKNMKARPFLRPALQSVVVDNNMLEKNLDKLMGIAL